MSYEEEDTYLERHCGGQACHMRRRMHACHMRRRIHTFSAIAEDVNVAKHLLVLDPRDRWGSWNNAGGQYNDVIPGFSLGMRNEFSLGWRVGRRQWSEQRWPTCV